jgi:hypothetical protein
LLCHGHNTSDRAAVALGAAASLIKKYGARLAHAKAGLFRRSSGLNTGYIRSSNPHWFQFTRRLLPGGAPRMGMPSRVEPIGVPHPIPFHAPVLQLKL